ncbi:MAG: hypothetical protein NT069_04650 [Planctomycetota bacterium]|nr:hypothetical protein [Planctomycetota bacterium]
MKPDSTADDAAASFAEVRTRWLEWFVIAALVSGMLFLGAARLPQQMKIPFVVTTGLASGVGFAMGRLAHHWKLGSARLVRAGLAAMVAGGVTLGTWDTHRRLAEFTRLEPIPQVADVGAIDEGIEAMLKQGDVPEGATNVNVAEFRTAQEKRRQIQSDRVREREFRQTFVGYLVFRVPRQWGNWSPPAAVAFWMAEVVVAAGLAAKLAGREVYPSSTNPI